MSAQYDFYLARAAEAKAAADTATLDNVRERSLRSEAAWSAMAARAERSDKAREKVILQKATAASESEALLRREA